MTVLPTQKIVRDATELGASYVFPKPFSSQAMIEKIARDQLAQMTPQAPPAQPEPQAPQVPQQGGPMNGQ